MWNLKKKKNYKNELIYTAETGLQTSKPKLGLPNGKGGWGNTLGICYKHTHTTWLSCGSAGEESACPAGDLGSIPGL